MCCDGSTQASRVRPTEYAVRKSGFQVRMSGIVAILGAALLASCSPGSTVDRDASADRSKTETHADANPSTVLRAPTTMADGLEVIV